MKYDMLDGTFIYDIWNNYGFFILVGLAGGLLGGIVSAFILWGGWVLPSLGLLLTRVSLVQGLAAVLIMTAVIGGIYGGIARDKVETFKVSAFIGVGIGVLVWALGSLVFIPIVLGFPPVFVNPLAHGLSLGAFIVYGLFMALSYRSWLGKKKGKWQVIIPFVAIILGVVAAPFLLRAAVTTSPENLAVEDGYEVEVVAKNFTYPTSLTFCDDGYLYFGQGSATNAGIVGEDNYVYGWLQDHPEFHDRPPKDITLKGNDFATLDLGDIHPGEEVKTGAFVPFGETTEKGQKIEGETPGNAAIYRAHPEKDYELELYAWGLRNPYGLAFSPEGQLHASVLGYDDRGARAIQDAPDFIYKIVKDGFYGWPDYVGEDPITDEKYQSDRTEEVEMLLHDSPELATEKINSPLIAFPPHFSPLKFDFSPVEFAGGMRQEDKSVPEDIAKGDLLVPVFGDGEPLTGEVEEPVPAMVLRLDMESSLWYAFLENKGDEPRAGRFGQGLNRPISVEFGPGGDELYVLDFGVFEFSDMAPNAIPRTGVLWKVTPSS